jgi:Skp family chaperone for outer membrane proteins
MELRVVDFEKLSRHYTNYQSGLEEIDLTKQKYIELIEPIKKEMNSLISQQQSGLLLDNKTQKERMDKFQSLQEQLVSIDKDANHELGKIREKITKKVYRELEEMISDWSKENSIDIVTGKIECVFVSPDYEITDTIIEVLKSKSLYFDYKLEEEKESV